MFILIHSRISFSHAFSLANRKPETTNKKDSNIQTLDTNGAITNLTGTMSQTGNIVY